MESLKRSPDLITQLRQLLDSKPIESNLPCTYSEIKDEWIRSDSKNTNFLHPLSIELYPIPADSINVDFDHLNEKDAYVFLTTVGDICHKLLEIDKANDQTGFNIINLNDVTNFVNFSVLYFEVAKIYQTKFIIKELDRQRVLEVAFHLCQVRINLGFIAPWLIQYSTEVECEDYEKIIDSLVDFFNDQFQHFNELFLDEDPASYDEKFSSEINAAIENNDTDQLGEYVGIICDFGNNFEKALTKKLSFNLYWFERLFTKLLIIVN